MAQVAKGLTEIGLLGLAAWSRFQPASRLQLTKNSKKLEKSDYLIKLKQNEGPCGCRRFVSSAQWRFVISLK